MYQTTSKIAPKSVPHMQHDFFLLVQRIKSFIYGALKLSSPSSFLKLLNAECTTAYRVDAPAATAVRSRFQIRSNDLLVLFESRKICNLEKARLTKIPNCFQRNIWRGPILRHDTCLSVIRACLTWPLFAYNEHPFLKKQQLKDLSMAYYFGCQARKKFFS